MGVKASKETRDNIVEFNQHIQWEYSTITKAKVQQNLGLPFGVFLDAHGEKGWELIAIDSPYYIFKRKKHKPRGRKKS